MRHSAPTAYHRTGVQVVAGFPESVAASEQPYPVVVKIDLHPGDGGLLLDDLQVVADRWVGDLAHMPFMACCRAVSGDTIPAA